jgi:hypothetical protein
MCINFEGAKRIESLHGCGMAGVEIRIWAATEIYFDSTTICSDRQSVVSFPQLA